MKALIKILTWICLLPVLSGKGQSLFYDKYYKTGYNSVYTNRLLQLEDTSYVFLNYVRDSVTGQQNMGVFKTDRYGNLLINKVYDFGTDYLAYVSGLRHFISATPSSLLVTAAVYPSSTGSILINKVNKKTLDTIKNTLYNDGLFNYTTSNIVKIHSNKFLLIGTKGNSTNWWPVLVEIDSNAVIQNSITCSNSQSLTASIAFNDTVNKRLVIGGQIGSSFVSFISNVDTLGNFRKTFINNTCSNGLVKIIYSSFDNTYIGIGSRRTSYYGGNSMLRLYAVKYDTACNIVWQKAFGKSNIINGFYDAVVNPSDGSIIAVGKYSDSLANPVISRNCNAIMFKIRSNGDSLWSRQWDSLNQTGGWYNGWDETFESVASTPEGGYIMAGMVMNMPQGKAWVVKTDSLGCDLASCMPTGIREAAIAINEISVYPNPTADKLTVIIPQGLHVEKAIITNALSQTVYETQLSSHASEINLSFLPNGVYFLNLSLKDKTIVKKIVKQGL